MIPQNKPAALLSALALVVAAGTASLHADEPPAAMTATPLTVHADKPLGTISRNIYGQFAEHLGRCIEEGLWVGEDSPIPNTRGIRNDVVAALKALQIPVLRWPGGVLRTSTIGRTALGRARSARP